MMQGQLKTDRNRIKVRLRLRLVRAGDTEGAGFYYNYMRGYGPGRWREEVRATRNLT